MRYATGFRRRHPGVRVHGSATGALPFGVVRLLGGVVFGLGLILVVVGGAELFTGNALISMAWASERVSAAQVLRHWLIVYIGNFLGAGATALLLYASAQYTFGNGAVGLTALEMARAKTSLGCKQAVSIKSDAALLASVGKSVLDYPTLSWTNFFWVNLLPVTVGNIIGGVGLVGLVYWFVYLRPEVNATTSLQPTEYERVVSLTNVPQ